MWHANHANVSTFIFIFIFYDSNFPFVAMIKRHIFACSFFRQWHAIFCFFFFIFDVAKSLSLSGEIPFSKSNFNRLIFEHRQFINDMQIWHIMFCMRFQSKIHRIKKTKWKKNRIQIFNEQLADWSKGISSNSTATFAFHNSRFVCGNTLKIWKLF